MTECEKCGLIVGLGCACDLPRSVPRRPYMGGYRWVRFGPDTLLISSRNIAHVPGACTHMTEEQVLDPENGWGWIPDPHPALWDRVSAEHPAQATEGDTSRVAKARCESCAATLAS
ncbi:RcnB family protein [Actinoallomurus soli]|uniref:RcnB family protein n=1 Tax=Actinoallomurus soli TaxID=2952535 RepID=UPI00209278FC|nr:RcnB family protein [Actinoallomurus soli]MCO5968956.1 RcnB family protein [Actinoallomurus soli]